MSGNSAERLSHADILLVDDEVSNLKFLIETLTKKGFKVRPASDGELALRSAFSKRPDLILLDVKMPDMDGIEVCKRLKANPETRDIPIIFLSALRETEIKVEALDSGGIDYVSKPVEPSELLARIHTHLHISRLQQNLTTKTQELMAEIREREMANEKARSFNSILEDSLNEIYVINADSLRFIQVNFGARTNLGYSQDELSRLTPLDIKPEFTRKSFEQLIEPLRSGEKKKIQFLTIHQRKDGSQYPVEIHFQLSTLESKKVFVAIVLDITKRKQAEESVRKLSQAVEQTGESIVITDRNGVIEYVNPAFTALTGYSAEEAIGQTPRILKSGNQDASFYENMWATITSGKVWHGKVIDKKKDGSFYPATLTISPIFDQSGKVAGYSHFVGIQSDLTRLEDLEHQFHQAQKMEAIGTLVGGIAHDFNNMLAGMSGNLYLAKQRASEMPYVVQKLENVESIALRASEMIQQLLTFARKDMVKIKQIPLNPFIKETLKLLNVSVPENIEMHQDICAEPLLINGDATQLHQVLLNLINNACDAVEGVDNPVITTRMEPLFHADETFIEHHSYVKGQSYAHVSVEDNGCGIPEHHLEHLFEPFFTTKDVGKGTGLGLSMVFGAIKTHHGFVNVESSKGKGSIFHLYIPLLKVEDIAFTPAKEKQVAKGHGELILLVDDDQGIIDIGKDVLESLGYRVLTASNGREAIEVFEQHTGQIDLCIFDVIMPIMSGDKAARQIRQIKPDIKIIFSTGYDKQLLAGVEHEAVLDKPFLVEDMSWLIRGQLDS